MVRLSTLETERPRERCLAKGARALSLRECLALILNSGPPGRGCLGLASDLLDRPGTGLREMEGDRAFFLAMEIGGPAHLSGLRGLGPAGQARILAAFEIGRRYAVFRESRLGATESGRHSNPGGLLKSALSRVSQCLRDEPQEWLGFVPCFRNGKVGSLCIVEKGARTHVNVEPGELFARVLALRPEGFFLFHNHPSGDPSPSDPDLELTSSVDKISRALGVKFLGHHVVSSRGHARVTLSQAMW